LRAKPGEVYTIPISHGEGRFVAPKALLDIIISSGQLATQYTDADGAPSMDIAHNPNGSMMAVEGLFSPDGRVFGKMGHFERMGENVGRNITGNTRQPIFEGGVHYYK
ncbi:MAG: phosphoribosylformylglycinamidine synthase subunit PurQ, partial [Oscillospiraceae bacterium]|nr:phosphoribosylformylglycinamidine synthase subunit PurQ [Oscillospiraceae bacterium]